MAEEWLIFAQKGVCVWVTYFKHRSVHKYTRVARGQDRVETKTMIDLACEEGYAAICGGCDDGERDGTRPLRRACSV